MPTALITGVTGFVGSALADYLIEAQNLEVHGIRRPRSRTEFIRGDVYYHEGDVTDYSAIAKIVRRLKPTYLFHLASQSFVPLSWEAPQATLNNNIIGTLCVLDAVYRESPETTVHVAGSSEEYGLVYPKECPVDENQPLRPLSPYGVSKVAADLLSQQYHKSYGIKVVISRAFNHTGPRRGEEFVTSRIVKNFAAIKLGLQQPTIRLGNLDAVRDFSDVRDVVNAYWLMANKCEYGVPYNIGSGIGRSIREVFETAVKVTGVKAEIEQDPKLMRPSDVPLLVCNSNKFRKATGWKPLKTFEETMKDLFEYWVNRLQREQHPG
jgi:GDP-4-dehydro-6-deoxy-D-mannose reductase